MSRGSPHGNIPVVPGYEVLTFLACGGTSSVWKARNLAGRIVAVKILDPDAGLSSRTEWQALRTFRSPNMVEIIETTITEDGRTALVLEYCQGGTLQETVTGRGGLTVGETAAAITPIAEVLAQLHTGGTVHGDLNPSNVLLTASGEPKLADLGCVRSARDDATAEWVCDGFVAPEVLDGSPPRPPADVYGLGALTWFALRAEAPPPPALRPHLHDVLPDVPSELCEAITASLALTPSARIDAQAFASALRAAGEPVAVPVERGTRSRSLGAMTRRRRADAVRQQSQLPPGRHREPKHWRRAFMAAGVVSVATLLGAFLIPAPGAGKKSSPPASDTATVRARPTATPSAGSRSNSSLPKRTVAPVHFPNRTEVAALLTCRARAWTSSSAAALAACLAPDSQALVDDTKRLKEAMTRKLTYSGLAYELESVERISLEAGRPTARVTIRQTAYSVHGAGKDQSVAAQRHRVRLTFSGGPGDWKLATWNVL